MAGMRLPGEIWVNSGENCPGGKVDGVDLVGDRKLLEQDRNLASVRRSPSVEVDHQRSRPGASLVLGFRGLGK
jgi:hypothetical protein